MRNTPGKMAIITNGVMGTNIGREVEVLSLIGYLEAESVIEYNNMEMRAPISDNYFWIFSKNGIDTPMGETSKAYAPDSWLMPTEPPEDSLDVIRETELDDVS